MASIREKGAVVMQIARNAMETAVEFRVPSRAIIQGAYSALRNAPTPHPAFSQP